MHCAAPLYPATANISSGSESLLQHRVAKFGSVKGAIDVRMGQPVFDHVGTAGQLGGDVNMGIDEARYNGRIRQIDYLGSFRRLEPHLDPDNTLAFNDD